MSYVIEYNRQFIRSNEGITPCWLAGENNLYEPKGLSGKERRVRSWGCFHNLIGVTEEDILNAIAPSLGGYGEHWKRNGKWIDDNGLIQWVKSGCKAAATIEEIKKENRYLSIYCSISVWHPKCYGTKEHEMFVDSTEGFDQWIREAREIIKSYDGSGSCAYPIVTFSREDLKHPSRANHESDEEVLIKEKGYYLVDISENGTQWSKNIRKAKIFTYEEAIAFKQDILRNHIAESKIISAKAKNSPYDFVLQVSGGDRDGMYIRRFTRARIYFTRYVSDAKRYQNKSTAKAAADRYATRHQLPIYGNLQVIQQAAK